MDWAEWVFPQYFPEHADDNFADPYVYRYYPATQNYLGVAGDSVFIMGPVSAGSLMRVGSIQDYACSVDPDSCAHFLEGVSAQVTPPPAYDKAVQLGPYGTAFVPQITIDANFSGNINLLGGRPLFIVLEDPAGTFFTSSLKANSLTSYTLALGGGGVEAGVRSGKVRIRLCLDAACATAVAGASVTVPYRLVVLGSLQVPAAQTSFNVGTNLPFAQDFNFQFPNFTTSWSASLLPASAEASVRTQQSADGTTGMIHLDFSTGTPGTRYYTLHVVLRQQPPNGLAVDSVQDIPLVINAIYSAAPFNCTSPALNFTMEESDLYGASTGWSCYGQGAAEFGVSGVEYLTWPAEANNNIGTRSWYMVGYNAVSPYQLPPGEYTARLFMDAIVNGVTTRYYFPMKLTVVDGYLPGAPYAGGGCANADVYVYDATGAVFSGATVTSGAVTAVTDNLGHATLKGIQELPVVVSAQGYDTTVRTSVLHCNMANSVGVTLLRPSGGVPGAAFSAVFEQSRLLPYYDFAHPTISGPKVDGTRWVSPALPANCIPHTMSLHDFDAMPQLDGYSCSSPLDGVYRISMQESRYWGMVHLNMNGSQGYNIWPPASGGGYWTAFELISKSGVQTLNVNGPFTYDP